MSFSDAITVVIPTSPIPSCPSTAIIRNTIESIRYHLPKVRILITADGIRPEQGKFCDAYGVYLKNLKDLCSLEQNTTMIAMEKFSHQVVMMRAAMTLIKTPLIFYVEHDLPLLPEPIDFDGISRVVAGGECHFVRLAYWSQILPEHQYLMIDKYPILIKGVPLVRTIQHSQHPHIATKIFYRNLLGKFSPDCRTMIENGAHGIVQNAPWEEWREAIYAPYPMIKRVYHSHGREEEPKYEETFIF